MQSKTRFITQWSNGTRYKIEC